MINLFDIKDKLYSEDIVLYSLIRVNDYPVRAAITSNGNLTVSAGGSGMTRESVAYFLTAEEATKMAELYNTKPYKIKLRADPIPKTHLTRIFNRAKEELLVPFLEEFDTNYGKCYRLRFKKDKLKKENLELFIYQTIEDSGKLQITDYSTKDATHLKFRPYFTGADLFEIKQNSSDLLQFIINLRASGEEFQYNCIIRTKEDFLGALERTIEALENYPQFKLYKNELQEVRDIYG